MKTKYFLYLLMVLATINTVYAQINPNPYYEVQHDEAGKPLFLKHQIIIAFHPDLIEKSIINNKEVISGTLADFITQEGKAIAIQAGMWNDNIANAPTKKIYEYLDTDDTLSLTRTGETISIPKYWATLLVFWPLNDETPITQVCDSLEKFYPLIEFAHPNYLYKQNGAPNDAYYVSDQFNLHPIGVPKEGNIDIEQAWDIETGSPNVKLGIFDGPIIYTHEDFGGGTLATSKIKGGKVYFNIFGVKDISQFPLRTTVDNHGTNVAGVAAAIRNNEKGIAGVAGGDFATGNTGASLYTFGIFGDPFQTGTTNGYCTDDRAADAISEGANYILQPNGTYTGYGLHIENHSWGGPSLSANVRRAVKGAARNKCALVCSRGNDEPIPSFGTMQDNYPAIYNDEWVISVGASGTDGERLKVFAKNIGNAANGGLDWSSSYGKKMDVLAPGAQSMVMSTRDPNFITQIYTACQYGDYCYFAGTSAAAPHVSGLAALILSKYRPANGFANNLEPEDVENLMEQYAKHTAPAPLLYNDDQAWGIINPDNTIDKIKDNRYRIHHFSGTWPVSHTNMGNTTLAIPAPGAFGLSAGNYTAQKWKIVNNYTNTFAPNEQILGYWPRLNASAGSNDFSSAPISEDDWAGFSFSVSGNTLTVAATTYAYYIPALNKWLYKDKNDVQTAYSVHTFNPTANAVAEKAFESTSLKAYPNPASHEVNIELGQHSFQKLELYDIKGTLIPIEYALLSKKLVLNTTNLVQGVYVCKTYLHNGSMAINKIVINSN